MLGLTMADRAQLEQVVLSLAVTRGPDAIGRVSDNRHGQTSISRSHQARAQVGAVAGPYVTLSVADTGVGMSPRSWSTPSNRSSRPRPAGQGHRPRTFDRDRDRPAERRLRSAWRANLTRQRLHRPPAAFDGAARPEEGGRTRKLPVGGDETILVAEDEDAVRQFVERVLTGAATASRRRPTARTPSRWRMRCRTSTCWSRTW